MLETINPIEQHRQGFALLSTKILFANSVNIESPDIKILSHFSLEVHCLNIWMKPDMPVYVTATGRNCCIYRLVPNNGIRPEYDTVVYRAWYEMVKNSNYDILGTYCF
jgi:hypothetical protein